MIEPIHNTFLNAETGNIIARKRIFSVWVVKSEDTTWKIYHCPDCRNPIAQYKGDLVMEVPGGVPEAYPLQIQCKNPRCGRKIVFVDAATQVSEY